MNGNKVMKPHLKILLYKLLAVRNFYPQNSAMTNPNKIKFNKQNEKNNPLFLIVKK